MYSRPVGEDTARLATEQPKARAPKPNRAARRKLEKVLKRKAKRDPKMRQLLGALEGDGK
jgi:hypothetical protein